MRCLKQSSIDIESGMVAPRMGAGRDGELVFNVYVPSFRFAEGKVLKFCFVTVQIYFTLLNSTLKMGTMVNLVIAFYHNKNIFKQKIRSPCFCDKWFVPP